MDEHLESKYSEVELYEKILVRERKRKAILIGLAGIVFLFLCGIPIYEERLPKWSTLQAARLIAVEIEKLKTESIQMKSSLQLSVLNSGTMKVEKVDRCVKPEKAEVLRESTWRAESAEVTLLDEAESKKANLHLAVQRVCFDPIHGLEEAKTKKVFVLVPVKDLAESRFDRASYIEVEMHSAKVSIN